MEPWQVDLFNRISDPDDSPRPGKRTRDAIQSDIKWHRREIWRLTQDLEREASDRVARERPDDEFSDTRVLPWVRFSDVELFRDLLRVMEVDPEDVGANEIRTIVGARQSWTWRGRGIVLRTDENPLVYHGIAGELALSGRLTILQRVLFWILVNTPGDMEELPRKALETMAGELGMDVATSWNMRKFRSSLRVFLDPEGGERRESMGITIVRDGGGRDAT